MPRWSKDDVRVYYDQEVAAGRKPYRTEQVNPWGRMICGSKTRSGLPCTSDKLGPAKRCRMHNGWPVKGIAHPNYKDGKWVRWKRDVPPRMRERYQEAVADTELLNLRQDIGLIDARISDLLSRVDTGESGQIWRALGKARGDVMEAQRVADTEKFKDALSAMLSLVGRGIADFAAWDDVVGLLEQRRKLVESEQKRLVAMQQMITVEQGYALIHAVQSSLRNHVLTHVDDPKTARAILAGIQQDLVDFSGVGAGQPALAGGEENDMA